MRWASIVTPAPEGLPLVAYWNTVRRGKDREAGKVSPATERAREEGKEAFLASCMKKQGFRYFPTEYALTGTNAEYAAMRDSRRRDNLPIPELAGDRETVAKQGYGVMTPIHEIQEKQLQSITQNKNDPYVASLTPQQRKQYRLAMMGPNPSKAAADPYAPGLRGCAWEANRKFADPSQPIDDEVLELFPGLIHEMMEFGSAPPVNADPRMVRLNTEWRACMEKTGVSVGELRASKPADMLSSPDGPQLAFALAVHTGADGKIAWANPGAASPRRDQLALTGSAPEVAIALADFDCRKSTNYVERLIPVQREQEQAFIRSYRKELDQLTTYVDQLR